MDAWEDGGGGKLGRCHPKPVGNSEGWGTINWLDHPALNWENIKEAGMICADLSRRYGYRFNCTSNFAHPQFWRLWNDVTWCEELAAKIRKLCKIENANP
jgi:hypothetical protein